MEIEQIFKECEKRRKKTTKFVKENPVEASIIALFIGFFIGRILTEIKNIFKK